MGLEEMAKCTLYMHYKSVCVCVVYVRITDSKLNTMYTLYKPEHSKINCVNTA